MVAVRSLVKAELIASEMSCVCVPEIDGLLSETALETIRKKLGQKKASCSLFVMSSFIETWGFKGKVVIFFPHLPSWPGLLQTLDILKSVCTYSSEPMEATRMP